MADEPSNGGAAPEDTLPRIEILFTPDGSVQIKRENGAVLSHMLVASAMLDFYARADLAQNLVNAQSRRRMVLVPGGPPMLPPKQ